MKYYVTHFQIAHKDEEIKQICRELLADTAGECGYETFLDTEEGIDGYIQTDYYDEQSIIDAISAFPIEDAAIHFTTSSVENQNWNETWEEEVGFEPICISDKIVVYDVRHTEEDTINNFTQEHKIGIRARNAFGTGTHQTTQMMLSSILQHDMHGKRVLDCGCGTGILGIAALKCGAQEVVAYDIDEWSVENTRCNADINGVGECITVLEGDSSVLSHVSGEFDVVLANIFREVLLADMSAFRSVMSSNDSLLLLSGFLEEDVPLLIEKAKEVGLKHISTVCNEEWRHLILHV